MSRSKLLPPIDDKHCTGCGAEFPANWKWTRPWVSIYVGKERHTNVCRHGVHSASSDVPKESCRVAAIARLSLCPGCNAERIEPGFICSKCSSLLEQGRLKSSDAKPVRLVSARLFPYLGHEHGESIHYKAVALLARVLGGAAKDYPHYPPPREIPSHKTDSGSVRLADPAVLVSEDQAEALEEFLVLWQKVFRLEREEGLQRGRSFILDLAEGHTSPQDFEKYEVAMAQDLHKAKGDVDKLK